jgi:hypothetical protein
MSDMSAGSSLVKIASPSSTVCKDLILISAPWPQRTCYWPITVSHSLSTHQTATVTAAAAPSATVFAAPGLILGHWQSYILLLIANLMCLVIPKVAISTLRYFLQQKQTNEEPALAALTNSITTSMERIDAWVAQGFD